MGADGEPCKAGFFHTLKEQKSSHGVPTDGSTEVYMSGPRWL